MVMAPDKARNEFSAAFVEWNEDPSADPSPLRWTRDRTTFFLEPLGIEKISTPFLNFLSPAQSQGSLT